MIEKRIGWLLMAVFFCLATAVNTINPIFEAPDEREHYLFVRYLIENRSLPVQEIDGPLSQSHQPPLYYMLGAILTAGVDHELHGEIPDINPHWTSYYPGLVHNDNKARHLIRPEDRFPYSGIALSMHLLRLFSTVCVTIAVGIVFRLSAALFGKDALGLRVLCVGVFAFNPMVVYISGSLNNDGLIMLLCTGQFWLIYQAIQDGYRWQTSVLIGVTWGLALLTKLPGLFICSAWGIGLLWVCANPGNIWDWRSFRWGFLLNRCVLISVVFLAITGWWFARNIMVYGEPLALERVIEVWGARQPSQYNWGHIGADMLTSWQNFWGRYGYGQIVFHEWFYMAFNLLTLTAVGGTIWRLTQSGKSGIDEMGYAAKGLWLSMIVAWPIYAAALFYYIYRNPTGGNGRYTYPALIGFAAIVAYGWGFLPERWRQKGAIGLTLVLLGTSIYAISFLHWTYAPPRNVILETDTSQDWYWLDGDLRLTSTSLNQRVFVDDEDLVLTACWESEAPIDKDYTFFINVTDPAFNKYGDRNTQMGLGNYPMSQWVVGEPFCELYRVPITTEWAERPLLASLRIGFYDITDGTPLRAQLSDEVGNDFVPLADVKIVPEENAPVEAPSQLLTAEFTQGVSLDGYDIMSSDDGSAFVQLWWSASGPLDTDYTVFIHLLDASGELIAQSDTQMETAQGDYPTSFWGAGEQIMTTHWFPQMPDVASGEQMIVGLYRPSDFARLARINGDDGRVDDVVLPLE